VESQRKPSELIFVVLNFVTATQSRGTVLRKHNEIDPHFLSRSISEPLLQSKKLGQIARDRRILLEDAITWMTVAIVAC
jgi:hypothetical protein